MAKGFEDLKIWQLSERLMIRIYRISKDFPKEEIYNLISQIRRAALSVPTNIAEGNGRYHNAESAHFMFNARGSAEEVRSLLYSSKDLGYLSNQEFEELNNLYLELIMGINGFIKSLRKAN